MKYSAVMAKNWYSASPMISFHMRREMSGSDFLSGRRLSNFREGGSVARARAAPVSMIRLSQRSCIALSTDSSLGLCMDVRAVRATAVMLTVS
jgi:hypothetical protein